MKNYFILFILSTMTFSCSQQEKKESRNIVLGDTITTASGLKYIFLKEGKGKPIRKNSKVEEYMDLYLNESDSIFWSTSTEKDSIIGFIHETTSMIKGFEELNSYLVEGDELIAILPDSIAYGKEGGNGMAPNTTLIYNPLIVKKVSDPKKLINDTLQTITQNKGSQAAINFYQSIIDGKLKNEFHTDMELIFTLLDSLTDQKLYKETEKLSLYFKEIAQEDSELQTFAFYEMLSLEQQGNINEAMLIVKEQLKKDSHWDWWNDKATELDSKLDSINVN
ncbi:FKBP-type peptidyl-prolyl cis-trans isomerase [Maribacter sp. IgM3_T14_3]|uniref:FKBP-type peptidyl-prolyl cis-trans isomerase n=1 Tax=Maribacter sp. IgM3_T14_3 TaxID=3415140 RepID=UPI003C6FF3FD